MLYFHVGLAVAGMLPLDFGPWAVGPYRERV